MEGYFKFRGKDSRDFGILISAMPQLVKPKRRSKEILIPGRNGSLVTEEDCYNSYTISIECGKRGTETLSALVAWLDGSGELILSTEPDKFYQARVVNQIAIEDVVYLYNSFLVQFQVFPFKYSVGAFGENFTLTHGGIVYNQGTVYSEPILTVYGSGNITLCINEAEFPLVGVMAGITIDSERMEVYHGSENCNGKYEAMTFPRFQVGENEIRWRGNVERVEVVPKWRWL